MNIDISDGGVAYIIGNVVEQGAYVNSNTNNTGLVHYGEEHHRRYAHNALYVVNNTFVNDASSGRFLSVPHNPSVSVVNRNNIYTGAGAVERGKAKWINAYNYRGNPGYVDAGSGNYHLRWATSPAVNAGINPGNGNGISLMPRKEYVRGQGSKHRSIIGGKPDLGAFEFERGD